MRRRVVGILDYKVGNLSSVQHALHALGYRSRVGSRPNDLEEIDCLILPGVGSFPCAMHGLRAEGMDQLVVERARQGKPILGICLGMQLLADNSIEVTATRGLGLIPGEVVPLPEQRWHIGWNAVHRVGADALFEAAEGQTFYFNHSYVFDAPPQFRTAMAQLDAASAPFPIAVRRDNVAGLQFHPEKSQAAGRRVLTDLIEGLCSA